MPAPVVNRSGRKGRQAGVTLLELLIAFTLLAMIMTALTGALRFAGKAWETGEARAEAKASFSQATGQLRRQAERILPLVWGVEDEAEDDRAHAFEGSTKRLRFAVVEPAYPTDPGIYLIAFDITKEAGEQILRYYRTAYREDIRSFEAVLLDEEESVELLRGAFDLSFGYARDDEELREPDWRSSWGEARKLPHLIRLSIDKAEGDDPAWPQTVVRLAVDTEFDCLEPLNAGICSLDE